MNENESSTAAASQSRHHEKFKDFEGKKFGRWTLIKWSHDKYSGKQYRPHWLCRCDCGAEKDVKIESVLRGSSKSCGCLMAETHTFHGYNSREARHPMYQAWAGLIARCTNPNARAYRNYGGRGIKVCDRWRLFKNFLEDMGGSWKQGLSIERIDVNGNYEPANCRWATYSEQCNNTRRNNFVTIEGERLTVTQWANRCGISPKTLFYRFSAWGHTKECLTPVTPVRNH